MAFHKFQFLQLESTTSSSKLESNDDLENYSFENWHLVQLALKTHPNLLFRLKSTRPSKRGYAIRKIICYLDAQREQKKQGQQHTKTARL